MAAGKPGIGAGLAIDPSYRTEGGLTRPCSTTKLVVILGRIFAVEYLLYRPLMSKRNRFFQRIAEVKEHIRDVPTEELVKRYNTGYLTKEGAIATREVLQERGEGHWIHESKG